jgi:serine phosphatase RsbU (regulator of sigma subunit)
MFNRKSHSNKVQDGYTKIVYDNSAVKIVLIAIMLMVLSLSFLSGYSYWIVKNAIVHKLKTQDLFYIVKSISSKVDDRIIRAKESSLILAEDPFVQKWLQDGEKDQTLGRMNKQKITNIARNYDYQKVFIVSAITGHYWTQNGILLDTVSKTDPDDSWFFGTLNCRKRVSVIIDYNNEYRDTFVFINVLVGDVNQKPLGIAGVGLNLKSISQEFKSYKFGQKSNMWLVNQDGRIYISEDVGHLYQNLVNYVPPNIVRKILGAKRTQQVTVEYKHQNGERYDLIVQSIASTNWKLVFQIPRSESIQVVQAIKKSTIFAGIIIMVLITFIFYFISEKIANPYKRAVQLGKELEKMVAERTRELREKTLELQDRNTKIMDSIEYAQLIQESILPTPSELRETFADYFIIWKPRDMVGGDFYWMKKLNHGYVIAVGDCTGHGVPGALMTMAANSILNYIVNETNCQNPALILKSFNRVFKATINKKDGLKRVNEGLDLGIGYFDQDQLIYAGAKTALYIKGPQGVKVISADGKGVGYTHVNDDYDYRNTTHPIHEEDVFVITTDGYLSQNGGEKDFSFGRKRFEQVIKNNDLSDLAQAKQVLEAELQSYMNGESQRDDITVIGFKIKP